MASLSKLKHLATQCAASSSATRSPTTSVPYLRRSRSCNTSSSVTLGMLFNRNLDQKEFRRRETSPSIRRRDRRSVERDREKRIQRRTLKELFAITTATFHEKENGEASPIAKAKWKEEVVALGAGCREGGGRLRRSLSKPPWMSFRHRFSKRAWRPSLVVIPE